MGPSVPACSILLVGDEMEMAAEIKLELERNGYLVRSVSLADVADIVHADSAALLILDRVLWGVDSLRTLEDLRKQGNKIPVLVISALSSADEIAKGLRAGADDYLAKPFEMAEFVARVEALLRRLGDVHTTKLRFDDLEIDLIAQTASRGGNKIGLLPRELKLLEYFLRRPGQVITRAMLLYDLWHYDSAMETNVVDAHVSNLRKKIDDYGQPSRIANVRGMGYMLCRRRR
jgi:two-component system, OmpR family, response regulator